MRAQNDAPLPDFARPALRQTPCLHAQARPSNCPQRAVALAVVVTRAARAAERSFRAPRPALRTWPSTLAVLFAVARPSDAASITRGRQRAGVTALRVVELDNAGQRSRPAHGGPDLKDPRVPVTEVIAAVTVAGIARHPQELDRRLLPTWGAFLSDFDWSHFLTLTFRRESVQEFARRQFLGYVARLERESGRSLFWFYGTEYGKLGRLHLHALTGNTVGMGVQLNDEWFQAAGLGARGFARVRAYDPKLTAAHYVTKYITKSLADYDLSAQLVMTPLFPRGIAPLGALGRKTLREVARQRMMAYQQFNQQELLQ